MSDGKIHYYIPLKRHCLLEYFKGCGFDIICRHGHVVFNRRRANLGAFLQNELDSNGCSGSGT